jgi:hypothetical protein
MDAKDILKTYVVFFVSENDEFDTAKKLEMLKFIENADESMIMGLFEKGEIEDPSGLLGESREEKKVTPIDESDKVEDATLIGEAAIMIEQVSELIEGDEILSEDLKNKLKDMLGMETDLKYKIGKAVGSAKKALETQLVKIQAQLPGLKAAISKGAASAVEKGKELAGKAVEHVKDTASSTSGAIEKATELSTGQVGTAALVAAALTAGVMAYRKFFSKAAQACKNAPDKKVCLVQYKIKARQAQITTMNAGKAKCAKSKNPAACKAKIDSRINTMKAKMRG